MSNENLTLSLCLKWLLLYSLKQHPFTADECLTHIHELLDPPPVPEKPNRRYSHDKVRLVLKELQKESLIVEVKEGRTSSYSITRQGYEYEKELCDSLAARIHTVDQALKRMITLMVNQNQHAEDDNMIVPAKDRSFLRSLISINDVVRVYVLDTLLTKPAMTIPQLHKQMLEDYSWTCSLPYFKIVCRNNMTEGVDEFNDLIENQPTLLQSEYQGALNRRRLRLFSIKDEDLAIKWLELYKTNAVSSLKGAYSYTTRLLSLLNKARGE